MEFIKTTLKDVYLIKPKVFQDERGFFLESYSEKVFAENGIEAKFVQDNHSLSVKKGVLRGLHFQNLPHEQAKLVRVTRGKVYDVIVDLRKDSETFGKWEGFELSTDNFQMLFIPRGFGHAYCTLEDNTEFMYKVDNFYAPEADSGIIWNDPDLAISWPIKNPILSEKDSKLQKFKDFISPFKL
ncbi:MAG: dTDP-4-dehydrorhamnose 3,5-epimerase [Candidatus Moranbacteria bacterium]|nr:dTDP-4-dehydrorhamnose 3,5-epimerase [Candidatus Moranbacteria bacterium]